MGFSSRTRPASFTLNENEKLREEKDVFPHGKLITRGKPGKMDQSRMNLSGGWKLNSNEIIEGKRDLGGKKRCIDAKFRKAKKCPSRGTKSGD